MINWFSKYRIPGLGTKPPAAEKPAAPAAPAPAPRPAAPPRQPKDTEADWAPRLQAAMGSDEALLAVLAASPVLAVKLAAVEALGSDDALRQAERTSRHHDRRVHRLAKRRHDEAVARRQARARAQALLASAQALTADADVAVNQLVALDRDWAALDAALLEPAQAAGFAELRERLASQVRARGDALQAAQRWRADAAAARQALQAVLDHAARDAAVDADALDAPMQAAVAVLQARPAVPTGDTDAAALAALADLAGALRSRLAWLADARARDAAGGDGANGAAAPAAGTWDALPAVADAALAQALARRFEAWQAEHAARSALAAAPPAARPARPARPAAPGAEQRAELDALLHTAEAALADGQTAALRQALQAIERWLDDAGPLRLPEAWQSRWLAVQAEGARLKGWQAWGGALARDSLIAEAEALARAAAAAVPPAVSPVAAPDAAAPADSEPGADTAAVPDAGVHGGAEQPVEGGDAAQAEDAEDAKVADRLTPADATTGPATAGPAGAGPRPPRLKLKAHADAIQSLRQRWRQLDRQGAAAKQSAWARFDAALQAAYQPVAAQQAAQQAQRERNLQQREALLTELEAAALPEGHEAPAAWRDALRVLDRFQLAWRPLGPLEHTVPAAARAPLQQRLRDAVSRIEQPLQQARDAAAARRERLIVDAEALVEEAGRPAAAPAMASVVPRVRELQARWADEARALPLARGVETALWARFKAATDAVFARREAGFAARDAEASAALAAREALIERLAGLPDEAAPALIERTLAEVERAWRQGADLPRGAVARLDARYDEARGAARQRLADLGRRRWHAECDALAARLALCDEREAAADAPADDLAARWSAGGDLPPAWLAALSQRWDGRAPAGPLAPAEVDRHLLRLELALELPATAEQQAARRELKLHALKEAMEGRSGPQDAAASVQAAWLALLRQRGTASAQKERLRHLLDALRASTPGTWTAPPARA